VDAIVADDQLSASQQRYLDIGTAYFTASDPWARGRGRRTSCNGPDRGPGGHHRHGSTAMYAVWELLEHRGVEVELYDRALTPTG
jgi:hypothetical protein